MVVEAVITRFGQLPFLMSAIARETPETLVECYGTQSIEAIAERIYSAHTATWHEDECLLLTASQAPWN